ncbi:MAG: DUF1080 domain-containing protein [Candidatus Poribacteria bacterium]|nr:DUF1080 domain-containing protein [Candidatus Poribacteria bacterium]
MRVTITVPKLAALSLVVLFGLALSLPTYAGTQLWDFEEKHDDWKVANGNWEIAKGVYHVDKGGQAEHSLVGEEDWDDYTIEAKVRLDNHHWAGIVFRAESEMEYYVYYLNVPNNKTELWRHKDGAWNARDNVAQIPAVEKVQIKNGEWIDMKVVVEGSEFQIYLNGKLQGEHKDDVYKTGQVGVWAWETEASFDDFTVSGDNIKDTLAVDPNRKLATTWGRLKRVY